VVRVLRRRTALGGVRPPWLAATDAPAHGTRFTDAFSGTNGDEIDGRASDTGGGMWDVLRGTGVAEVEGNGFAVVGDASTYAVAVIGSSGTDQSAEVVNNSGSTGRRGVGVRIDSAYAGTGQPDGYLAMRESGASIRFYSGTVTIDTLTAAYVAGETIYIEAVGTEVTIKHNGTTIYGPATPGTTRSSGHVGVLGYRAGVVDSFDGGDFGAAPGGASATVSAGGASSSASASSSPPTFTATASGASGGSSSGSSASHVPPTFTATTVVGASGGGAASATASFVGAGTFSASAVASAGGASAVASGSSVVPAFDASASVATGGASAPASATHTPPTFAASASVEAGGARSTSAAFTGVPTFTATAAALAGSAAGLLSATFDPPTFTATILMTSGGAQAVAGTELTSRVNDPVFRDDSQRRWLDDSRRRMTDDRQRRWWDGA